MVSLMKVEKVPDSTYDMIGGLDQQIKEIKEVLSAPPHPTHNLTELISQDAFPDGKRIIPTKFCTASWL